MSDSPNSSSSVADPISADRAVLQAELVAQKEDLVRLAADFDNFRKRTRRDSEQHAAAEKEAFIQELLPTLDNLERALACEGASSSAQLHRGVEMTLKQLAALLERHGVEPVEAEGHAFDPAQHEAVAVRHDPRQPDHVILEVVQRGYRRGNKVFRPAKVIVNDPGHSPRASRGR